MTWNHGRALGGILLTAGVLAGTALAATPESGTVSDATPKVTWEGALSGSWLPSRAVILEQLAGQDGRNPCQSPTCDTFRLTVADQRDLSIGISGPEADDQIIYRIKTPDGGYVSGTETAGANGYLVIKIKNAAKGEYLIQYWDYYVVGATHQGYAELAVAKPAAPAPGSTPTPGGTPGPGGGGTGGGGTGGGGTGGGSGGGGTGGGSTGGGSTGGTTEAIALTVKPGKASAKKLARTKKFPVKVTVSRAVSKITAVLKAGKKTVGRGSLGATSGTKTLNLKVKKLKKGKKYKLTVVATDGRTQTSKTVTVKVGK